VYCSFSSKVKRLCHICDKLTADFADGGLGTHRDLDAHLALGRDGSEDELQAMSFRRESTELNNSAEDSLLFAGSKGRSVFWSSPPETLHVYDLGILTYTHEFVLELIKYHAPRRGGGQVGALERLDRRAVVLSGYMRALKPSNQLEFKVGFPMISQIPQTFIVSDFGTLLHSQDAPQRHHAHVSHPWPRVHGACLLSDLEHRLY